MGASPGSLCEVSVKVHGCRAVNPHHCHVVTGNEAAHLRDFSGVYDCSISFLFIVHIFDTVDVCLRGLVRR